MKIHSMIMVMNINIFDIYLVKAKKKSLTSRQVRCALILGQRKYLYCLTYSNLEEVMLGISAS